MITGAIKNKVDKIWTDIWAGGIANPLTVIEQLTYLMFIRSLDEKELENEEFENMTGEKMPKIFPQSAAGQSMRWSKFKNDDPRRIHRREIKTLLTAAMVVRSIFMPLCSDFLSVFEGEPHIIFSVDGYEIHQSAPEGGIEGVH